MSESGRVQSDDVTITVSKEDLLFVLTWAEGGLAEYNRPIAPQVERVRAALSAPASTQSGDDK